jgi:phosphatidylinositol alpha-1,6-mannosyltransferase
MSPEPLRLGLLAADLNPKHGWGAYSVNLVHALRASGVALTVVAARNTPPIDGVDVRPLLPTVVPRARLFLPALLAAAPAARAALADCTVIHATAEPFAPLAALIAGSRPLFITGHGSYVRFDRAFRLPQLYRWAFGKATLVCVSHYTAQTVQSLLPGARTVVVNNGVHAGRFAQLPPLNETRRGPVVLTVGALKPRKGTLELVQAMARVVQTVPDAECVIIGALDQEPAYVARVRQVIEQLGLGQHVRLLGQVSEDTLLGWYGAAAVFAMVSLNRGWRFEGFGLTLLEASAAGLPVVGACGNGSEDAVDEGVTGLLVDQTNVEAGLADALVTLITDPERAARMGEAGRAKAARQTWAHVAAQMQTLYAGRSL